MLRPDLLETVLISWLIEEPIAYDIIYGCLSCDFEAPRKFGAKLGWLGSVGWLFVFSADLDVYRFRPFKFD